MQFRCASAYRVFGSEFPPVRGPVASTAYGYLEKYRFFWEWQRDLKGSSLLKAAKWQLIEVPLRKFPVWIAFPRTDVKMRLSGDGGSPP